MKINQHELIGELLNMTNQATDSVKKFRELSLQELNFKSNAGEWSILECIEHLNLYGNFYLPEIEKQLLKSKTANEVPVFRSGILGNYFVNVIKADSGKKMKATKNMAPANSQLTITTIDRFLKQLEKFKSLLHQSKKADLNKVKTAISLTKFVKLRLGDTLRFLAFHNERHILQAQRIVDKKRAASQTLK